MKCRPLHSILVLGLFASLSPIATGQDGWFEQPCPVGHSLTGVDFIDGQTGWICGSAGTLLHTTDGGASWQVQVSHTSYTLRAISFANENLGLAVGDGGTILRTTDGGDTWVVIRTDWMDTLHGIHFLDEQHAWAVGQNAIFAPFVGRSTNGGQTWTFSTFYIENNEGSLRDVHFVSSTVGFAAAVIWDGRGAVCRTTNGGVTWTTQIVYGNAMSCIDMSSPQVGTAAGMNGSLLRTTDGGDSWSTQYSGVAQWIRGVRFPTDEIGFGVGDAGTILRTEDGGAAWDQQESGTAVALADVDFSDTMIGTAVGELGTILRTVTGGMPAADIVQESEVPGSPLRLLPGGNNPFCDQTEVRFEVSVATEVRIEIVDVLGRCIHSVAMPAAAGRNSWIWDGADASGRQVAVGAYFCRLQIDRPAASRASKTLLYWKR